MPLNENKQQYVVANTGISERGLVAIGIAGAIITGANTAARKLRNGDEFCSDMMTAVAKDAVGGGLATAAGASASRFFRPTSFLGLGVMIGVTVGVKYVYDGLVCHCPQQQLSTSNSKE